MWGRWGPGAVALATFASVLAGCSSGGADGTTPAEIESRHLERHGIAVSCTETTMGSDGPETFQCTEVESYRTLIVEETPGAPDEFVVTLVDESGGFVADYALD